MSKLLAKLTKQQQEWEREESRVGGNEFIDFGRDQPSHSNMMEVLEHIRQQVMVEADEAAAKGSTTFNPVEEFLKQTGSNEKLRETAPNLNHVLEIIRGLGREEGIKERGSSSCGGGVEVTECEGEGTSIPHDHQRRLDQQEEEREEEEMEADEGEDECGTTESQEGEDVENLLQEAIDALDEDPSFPEKFRKPEYERATKRYQEQFEKYCRRHTAASTREMSFNAAETAAIELLDILQAIGAPLTAYQRVFGWGLRFKGVLKRGQKMTKCRSYISRERIFKKLRDRYGANEIRHTKTTDVILPESGERVSVIHHDVGEQIVALLTDPRTHDDDYLFHKGHFYHPPPNPNGGDESSGDESSATSTGEQLEEQEASCGSDESLAEELEEGGGEEVDFTEHGGGGRYDAAEIEVMVTEVTEAAGEVGWIAGGESEEDSTVEGGGEEVGEEEEGEEEEEDESLDGEEYYGDLITGKSYRETYHKLITCPKSQVLLPTILYIDASVTGCHDSFPVTALKMSLGIHKKHKRNEARSWKILGYVPVYREEKGKGEAMFADSMHTEAQARNMREAATQTTEGTGRKRKLQNQCPDFHAVLQVIMKSYEELQKDGFLFDFMYKGVLYPKIQFIPYVCFIKCDTEEADRLCSKYLSRTGGVKQLCRYCTCPTLRTGDPSAKFSQKTKATIQKHVENALDEEATCTSRRISEEKLRGMSQNVMRNTFWRIRFGMHDNAGVHGACPFEMLHFMCLGWFCVARQQYFSQISEKKGGEETNALSVLFGGFLKHQSDREMPRTQYSHGIATAKRRINAREYTGVLLLMALMCFSRQGKILLQKHATTFTEEDDPDQERETEEAEDGAQQRKTPRKYKYFTDDRIRDWLLLLETLLQWEQWMRSPRIHKYEVHRAKTKFKVIMVLMKKVASRVSGMRMNIVKFHAILHVPLDIELYGVPSVVDTECEESHHKITKKAARKTQRRLGTFEKQTNDRMEENFVTELASEEMSGRPLWEYWRPSPKECVMDSVAHNPETGGMRILVGASDDGQLFYQLASRTKVSSRSFWGREIVELLNDLQDTVRARYHHKLPLNICTMHKRGGNIFRATPGKSGQLSGRWMDWAIFQWRVGRQVHYHPGHIWCFVDLSKLPEEDTFPFANHTTIRQGCYAIIESADYEPDGETGQVHEEADLSTIFRRLRKEASGSDAVGRRFHIVHCDTIVRPATVVPDFVSEKDQTAMQARKKKQMRKTTTVGHDNEAVSHWEATGGGGDRDYIEILPTERWREQFSGWLRSDHKWDREMLC